VDQHLAHRPGRHAEQMATILEPRHRVAAEQAQEAFVDQFRGADGARLVLPGQLLARDLARSEEHTSELQSREKLVCRLLLEKKKYTISTGSRLSQTSSCGSRA